LIGGALIGLAASLLLWSTGRIAGISGIVAELLLGARGDRAWRAAFLAGLVAAGVAFALFWPGAVGPSPRTLPVVAVAGVLVGVGTRLGNGCTSGHGVCGISRLSPRSIVATLTFMATGILTVGLWRWFIAT
jgi:uncharacterized membrane protein YedE/YeeE